MMKLGCEEDVEKQKMNLDLAGFFQKQTVAKLFNVLGLGCQGCVSGVSVVSQRCPSWGRKIQVWQAVGWRN
jgi:hypothetical protein